MSKEGVFFHFCVISKKNFKILKIKIGESSKPGSGSGRVGVGVGVAAGAGRPAPAWTQRHLYVSPPPLSNPFSPALLSVALLIALLLSTLRATFSCPSSALASVKPSHLCSASFWCSLRQQRTFHFPFCVRTVSVYSALAPGKLVVFCIALCFEL